jgi:hypothetical protein
MATTCLARPDERNDRLLQHLLTGPADAGQPERNLLAGDRPIGAERAGHVHRAYGYDVLDDLQQDLSEGTISNNRRLPGFARRARFAAGAFVLIRFLFA